MFLVPQLGTLFPLGMLTTSPLARSHPAVFDNAACFPAYVLQYTAAKVHPGQAGAAGVPVTAPPPGVPRGGAFTAAAMAAIAAGMPAHLAAAFAAAPAAARQRAKRKHG